MVGFLQEVRLTEAEIEDLFPLILIDGFKQFKQSCLFLDGGWLDLDFMEGLA
jgi:hypothetical protein